MPSDGNALERAICDLERRLTLADKSNAVSETLSWAKGAEDEYGESVVHSVCAITRCIRLVQGDTYMRDKIEVNGGMVGTVGGDGNSFVSKDITAFNREVADGKHLNAELKQALMDVRAEAENLTISDGAKATIFRNIEELTINLNQSKPDKTALQILWAGITAVTTGLASVAKLGTLLGPIIGLPTSPVPPTP